jgi:cysteine desulfurase
MNLLKNLLKPKRIYLDYASLTPIDRRVINVINKYSRPNFANPSSLYKEGVSAKESLKNFRDKIAGYLHAHPSEIFFTSGGTESNNLAILGTVEHLHNLGVEYDKMHVLISIIEHSSIRECANHLQEKGVEVELLTVDEKGLISLDDLKKKIKSNTVIVSVMTVNNEIGTIEPIKEIAKTIRYFRSTIGSNSAFNFQDYNYPIFHTDASQAFLYEDLNVEKMGVDLLTLDSSKVYGPRSAGLLFKRKNTPVEPIIFGGGQELGLRSGTENLPSIAGFARALEIATLERNDQFQKVIGLRDYFIEGLKSIRKDITINGGDGAHKSPHILNVQIPKIDNEFFVLQLDSKGIACSTKSSCLGDEEESYVLNAIGANSKESVRFSIGRYTTISDIKKALRIIAKVLVK